MNKIKFAAVAVAASALMTATPALAASPGQLQGGDNTYVVKNVTKNGSYANSVNAVSCGDTVKYSVQLANTGFGELTNINVKSTLGSTSNMTAIPAEGTAAGTSAAVTVGLAAGQTLVYDAGSTKLYNGSGAFVRNLNDGITAGGVNVGNLAGSTNEFVNFTAKVNCATTPEPPKNPDTPTPDAPVALPEAGAAGALSTLIGTSAMVTAAMLYRRSRRK